MVVREAALERSWQLALPAHPAHVYMDMRVSGLHAPQRRHVPPRQRLGSTGGPRRK